MTSRMRVTGQERVRVCVSDAIPDGGRLVVEVRGREVGIFRVEGVLFAYENTCPHAGGPVCQGRILPRVEQLLDDGRRTVGQRWATSEPHIICPWHGYEYDLRTGRVPARPEIALTAVGTEEADGDVYVIT